MKVRQFFTWQGSARTPSVSGAIPVQAIPLAKTSRRFCNMESSAMGPLFGFSILKVWIEGLGDLFNKHNRCCAEIFRADRLLKELVRKSSDPGVLVCA